MPRSPQVCALIPARLESTRIPRKMLKADTGMPVLEHTLTQVSQCRRIHKLFYVPDAEELWKGISSQWLWHAVSEPLPTGTDRTATAALEMGLRDDEIVLHVHGDEPEISPVHLDSLIESLQHDSGIDVAQLVTPASPDSGTNRACCKVAVDGQNRVRYYSRANLAGATVSVGAFALRVGVLRRFRECGRTFLEHQEDVEQVRFIEMNLTVRAVSAVPCFKSIDTPADYKAFLLRWRQQHREAA